MAKTSCCIRRAGNNCAIVSRLGYIWIWSGARDQESTNHSARLLSESLGMGFVKWLKMTVYGHFGTMAETVLKYTRDFSKFPFIIRAANLNHRRNWRKDKSSPWGVILVEVFRMQIVVGCVDGGATVLKTLYARQTRNLRLTEKGWSNLIKLRQF